MRSARILLVLSVLAFQAWTPYSWAEETLPALALTPDLDNGFQVFQTCATCHDATGWGKSDGRFPNIAGQHAAVLIRRLSHIRSRNLGTAGSADSENLDNDQSIADVAAYIETLPVNPRPGRGPGLDVEHGQQLYSQVCIACHGPNAVGKPALFAPRLNGQHYRYLVRQIEWIQDGRRLNPNAAMAALIRNFSERDIQAVADAISRFSAAD